MLFGALFLLIARSTAAAEGVRSGLALSYRSILPALFPTAVVCGMIGELADHLPLPATATVWLTAQLCGFPLGIKTAVRAYRRGLINADQCLRLSRCCANASPSFLIGYFGGVLRGDRTAGLLLYSGQLALSFLIALRHGVFSGEPPLPQPHRPLIALLTEGIGGAASGCLTLTAYVAAFSAIAALCAELPFFSRWYGFLELTGGITALPPMPLWYCGMMVGFSSLSVFLQNAAFLVGAGLSPLPMLHSKLIYAGGLAFAAACPQAALFFFFFALFLISFDKRRKKSYNNLNVKREWRSL